MTTLVQSLVESLFRLLAPSTCAACGAPPDAAGFADTPRVFCRTCGAPSRVSPLEIEGVPVVVAGEYAPPLSVAVKRFKFEGHPELARPLSSLLAHNVEALELGRSDAWVPVPLHRARLIERGYNQAALLARALAARTRARTLPLLLERCRDTSQQARLARGARADNTLGAFRLRRPFSGRSLVLVDDVVTTGATVRACLAALREEKVAVRAVVALAQASGRSC